MSLRDLINDKKIIFCGPLFNKDDEFLKEYDTVIRTNNFFSIDPQIRNSSRCDILVCNSIFSKRYTHKIIENIDTVQIVLSSSKSGTRDIKDKLFSVDKSKVVHFSGENDLRTISRNPLSLMTLVSYIANNFKPELFFIDGIDFYSSNNVSKFWLKGYAIKESSTCNVLGKDKYKHDIQSNKDYLKAVVKKYSFIKLSDLVINSFKISKQVNKQVNKPKKIKIKKSKFKIPD